MKRWRGFLATVLVAVCMISCTAGNRAANQRLSIYNWTYYTPDSVIEKFEQEFNVTIIYDQFTTNEELYAKLMATRGGAGYDIVFPSGDFVPIMIEQDMLEKMDHSKLPNLQYIDPVVLEKAVYDPNMEYSVPYYFGAAGIIVNTARVPNYEENWSIFARQDLRGRMVMLDDMREVMGAALSYLGYSINTTNPAEVAEARDLINTVWKPNIVKFDSESFGKGYAAGDFWVVHGYAEAVYEEIEGDTELLENTAFFIPQEGGPGYIDSMCILKGARNIDMAHEFINFIHRPDIYAEFVDYFSFPSTVNEAARELKEEEPLYEMEDLLNTTIAVELGEDIELYRTAWFDSIRSGE